MAAAPQHTPAFLRAELQVAGRVALPPFPSSPNAVVVRAARAWTPALSTPAPATLLIVGGRIHAIVWGSDAADPAAPATSGPLIDIVVPATHTLIPGLIDCHNHSSFANSFDFDTSAFATAASTAGNLLTLLRAGFTSIHSAAACKLGVEAALRTLVHEGRLPGPRWRTAGPELTPTGGLGAGTVLSPYESDCFGWVCDGIPALVAAVAECAAFGTDTVKLNVSGEEMLHDAAGHGDVKSTYARDAVAAVVAASHAAGMRVAVHARGSTSVQDSVAGGVDILYHSDFADDAGRAAMLTAGDRLLLGPSLGFLVKTAEDPGGLPGDPLFDAPAKLAASLEAHRYLLEVGGEPLAARIGIGGDYGFAVTPHGDNAQDAELYVSLLGMRHVAALRCATSAGARFMGEAVGHLEPGFAGDVVAVRGDPTADVGCLRGGGGGAGVDLVVIGGRIAKLTAWTTSGGDGVGESGGVTARVRTGTPPHATWSIYDVSSDSGSGSSGGDATSLGAHWLDEEGVRQVLRDAYRARYPAADAAAVEVALGTSLGSRRAGSLSGGVESGATSY